MLTPDAQRCLTLLQELIRHQSITPNDAGCTTLLVEALQPLGFECEIISAGPDDALVTNLWAFRRSVIDQTEHFPTLVFAGHTDVVPTGPLENWQSPPFEPTIRDGRLYGRGTSDMKGSIAVFIIALQNFLAQQPNAPLNIALLITSDEEGPAIHGTAHVVEILKQRGTRLDYCIVGEPSATRQTGDMIKTGRRGSLGARLVIHGIQGHIAYPHLANNPIHLALGALNELTLTKWDTGNAFFPPTSFQISNVHSGTGATNVIPENIRFDFNFRFSTESNATSLKQRVHEILDTHKLTYDLDWTLSGEPFLTDHGQLIKTVEKAILTVTGLKTELSTSGGTSDGRFIAKICPQVVEVGPPNDSIHKIDENIALSELAPLLGIYQTTLENLANSTSASNT